MGTVIYQVNAFTGVPFTGNPAGVCVLDGPADSGWMQKVATEMNLPETAFLYPEQGGFNLRWFSPVIEVELCGHATLASAHVLWETGALKRGARASFDTRSGLLTAKKAGGRIELDFPREEAGDAPVPDHLMGALGVEPVYVGRNRFDYLLELGSEAELRGLTPDVSLLREVQCRGIIVTSLPDSPEYDFISRFFAPSAGIDEDPVTGSAHCCLGPYWEKKLGKSEFNAYQASDRGGDVYVRVEGDRVILGGEAVTVLKSELLV